MNNKKAQIVLDILKESGLPDAMYKQLVVIGDRMTNILTVLGMNEIPKIITDLKTVAGRQSLIVIESELPFVKPAIQIMTDVLKSFATIAVEEQLFEINPDYSGHLLYLMHKLDKTIYMHIEMPFFDGCVSELGHRALMRFLDAVTE